MIYFQMSTLLDKKYKNMRSASRILLIIGGINWGLVGLSSLVNGGNWNVVNMILGSIPVLEAIVYVLVGIAGVMALVDYLK